MLLKAAASPASTINTASSYDYLKQCYEKVNDDPGGTILSFLCKPHPLGFKKQLCTSSTPTANVKRHIELKHLASLSRYARVNQKSKTMATASQNSSSTTQITLMMYSSGSVVFISQPQEENLVLQFIVGELQFQC